MTAELWSASPERVKALTRKHNLGLVVRGLSVLVEGEVEDDLALCADGVEYLEELCARAVEQLERVEVPER